LGQLNSDGYVAAAHRALAKPLGSRRTSHLAHSTFRLPDPSIQTAAGRDLLLMGALVTLPANRGLSPYSRAGICRGPLGNLDIMPRILSRSPNACRHAYLLGVNSSLGIVVPASSISEQPPGHRGLPARRDHAAGQPRQATGSCGRRKNCGRDLIFWKVHVAIARDADSIVHANAHQGYRDRNPREASRASGRRGSEVTAIKWEG